MNAVLLTIALMNINPAPTSVRVKMDDQPVAWLYIAARHKTVKSITLPAERPKIKTTNE